MADTITNPATGDVSPAPPSFYMTLAQSLAQKAVTVAATALVANGVIQNNQEAQFISLGVGLVMFAGSIAWTYIRSKIDHKRTTALVNQVVASTGAPPK